MNATTRTTLDKARTDLRWCERQLANPDEVTPDLLAKVRDAITDVLGDVLLIEDEDLAAEPPAVEAEQAGGERT